MLRILAIADETDPGLTPQRIREIDANLIVSCGDLPIEYLEYVADASNRPVVFVPGNHDSDLAPVRRRRLRPIARAMSGTSVGIPSFEEVWGDTPIRPLGCDNIDGTVLEVGGLRFAGLGGSIRYRPGPNQYTQREMARRARRLGRTARKGYRRAERAIDVFVAHSPPKGVGDGPDGPHEGFEAFHDVIERLNPRYMLHGHIHPHGFAKPDRTVGTSEVINVIPYRVLEVSTQGGVQ